MINTFLRRMNEDVPLMSTERFDWMTALTELALTDKDIQAAEHPVYARIRESLKPQMQIVGDVAVMPIQGPLAYAPDLVEMLYFGVEDSRNVLKMIQGASANPDVHGGLVQMDTPGGMMLGGPEIGDAVAAMVRAGKPVVTHIGGLGASLGYMIASQSSKIVASRSAMVGSIGVISSVVDYTELLKQRGIKVEVFTNKDAKFKAAGAIGTSLSDEQRSHIQDRIESAFGVFKGMVLSARPKVKAEAMQGQVFRGDEAMKLGLVDATGGENFAMSVLRQEIQKRQVT